MSNLTQLIYVSKATIDFSPERLTGLLSKIRPNNQQRDISGMLLHDGGAFMQVLEGDRAVLDDLFDTIQTDPRHTDVVLILEKPIAKRQFPDWSMGFTEITDEMLGKIDGLNDFYEAKTCLKDVDVGRAVKILDSFSRGNWH